MTRGNRSPRIELARQAAILQIKLLVDGLRDALLIPLSLVAALFGLLRGGDDCDREFQRVLKLGIRSERWINLFGHHQPVPGSPRAGSVDSILDQVETAVIQQVRKNKNSPRDDGKKPDGEPDGS